MKQKVAQLDLFKRKQRTEFLKKYEKKLEQFIFNFLQNHYIPNLNQLANEYAEMENRNQLRSWDHLDLREILLCYIQENLGDILMEALKKTTWFDARIISLDEIVDRCTSSVVLGNEQTSRLQK